MTPSEKKLVKELHKVYFEFYGKHCGDGSSWLDVDRHVRKMLIRAQIESLKWSIDPTEGKNGIDPYFALEQRIAELEKELAQ